MEFLPVDYAALALQLDALLSEADGPVCCLANAAALVMETVPGLNWAGFYRLHGEELTLGPFQGRPACVRIPLGRGVCSAAVTENRTVLVPDVTAFPGHIACDARSRSELVVPLRNAAGEVRGVLDLDSAEKARFTAADAAGMEQLCRVLESKLPGNELF